MALTEAKKGAIITAIVTFLTGGGFTFYNEYILTPQIEKQIETKLKEKKGSMSAKLADELAFDRDVVPHKFAVLYKDFYNQQKIEAEIFPKINEDLKYYNVGLKVEIATGRIKYLHTDGHIYDASTGGDGRYYFINPLTNAWESCK